MANIREQSAPGDLGLTPTDRGVSAFEGAARRTGAFYNQAAEAISDTGRRVASTINDVGDIAVKYEDHREISKGAADGARMIAKANDLWNEKLKDPKFDPNDATAAQKFRDETLEPALEQFKSGFNTERSQQWAEHFVDQYRTHMFEKTSADMSAMAGIAVKVNYEKTKNMLSSAVASDPSSLDFALKSVDHSVGAMADSSPNLDATVAAKVKLELTQDAKQQIVKSAISSMIQKNPNIDLDAVQKKYGAYVNGAEMKMFQKAAQTQAKVDTLQAKQAEAYARQQQEHKANDAMTKVMTDNITVDPQTNRPVIKPQALQQTLDIARKYPEAGASSARTMIDWIEHQQNQKAQPTVSDPIVRRDLTDRMFDTSKPTTTRDLMKAQIDGKLSDHDYAVMHRLITDLEETPLKGPVWQATAAAAKDALIVNVPGLPGKDTKGVENYSTFMQTFLPQYIAKSRAGTLEPNALDLKDPNSMISKAMAPFKRTPSQRMQDYVSVGGGLGAPAATPARNDVMPAIPAPEQRNVGSIYATPKGNMKWTGTGWVTP